MSQQNYLGIYYQGKHFIVPILQEGNVNPSIFLDEWLKDETIPLDEVLNIKHSRGIISGNENDTKVINFSIPVKVSNENSTSYYISQYSDIRVTIEYNTNDVFNSLFVYVTDKLARTVTTLKMGEDYTFALRPQDLFDLENDKAFYFNLSCLTEEVIASYEDSEVKNALILDIRNALLTYTDYKAGFERITELMNDFLHIIKNSKIEVKE